MKVLKNILFYLSVLYVPLGVWYRTQDWGGSRAFIIGLLGISIYFLARTIKDLIKKRAPKTIISFQIVTILMSVILFTRYLFWRFGDYPGLIIVPAYIFLAWYYLKNIRPVDFKLVTVTILYLILTIPLFGIDFHNSPRNYFPKEWYKRFNPSGSTVIKLPYEYKYKQTEDLCKLALELENSRNYKGAINYYGKARKLEPQNPRILFDLSDTYSTVNNLEMAVALLDTAIMLDSTSYFFYSNRGLLHYSMKNNKKAIKDLQKAIKIDSTMVSGHINISLTYYEEYEYEKACISINKLKELGFDFTPYAEVDFIRKTYCE